MFTLFNVKRSYVILFDQFFGGMTILDEHKYFNKKKTR